MEACGLGGGYVLPLGCSLVSGWRDGGNSESGVGPWWAEALLYGLKVMTDCTLMSELVWCSEMEEFYVCLLGLYHTNDFCIAGYNRARVGKQDVMRLEV